MLNILRRPTATQSTGVASDLLRLRISAGVTPDELVGMSERCARAVDVARAVGAPLGDAVDGARIAEADAARARRAVQVASAQTRAVASGLLAAPLLLVPGLGRLVGADPMAFYTTGLGVLVLGAGGSLLVAGSAIIVVLIRRVGRADQRQPAAHHVAPLVALVAGVAVWRIVGPALAPLAAITAHHVVSRVVPRRTARVDVDEAADLAATALAGGVSVPEALRVSATRLPALALDLRRLAFALELGLEDDPIHTDAGADTGVDAIARLRAVLVTADRLGAPAVATLRRLAADLRADDLARVLAAAERLPAQLTFPTALCLLPATVLLVGAPIVHAGLAASGT